MSPIEQTQNSLNNLIRQCTTGDAQAIVTASSDLSRALGQMRANDLISSTLVGRNNPIIFDVGANEGVLTELYRQQFPTAIIHAFEPHPQAYKILQDKFVNDPNIFTNNFGIADAPDILLFNLANQSGSSSFLPFSDDSPYVRGTGVSTVDSMKIDVTCIDSYCEKNNIDHIDFMKLDVQGFEPKVILGASNMLARKSINAIQTEIVFRDFYKSASSFLDIEQHLIMHGFTLRCIYDIYPAEGAQIFQCDAIYTLKTL